ncbi:DNA repair protein RecN [Oxalobacter paraformigenes]|uniref:DNA repair protein RecN n=1 Tax=Oxalobacter paraformigenes TaxID=556268 RepID=C3X6M7_9BURK|nr:DNA repair protein RecN [Oxalobacter paraformigenes]EEO28863.1 DNA repair protein RecN [Oxalobacter paraformigenes]
MLRTLTVHDFVIVDSLELDFASGFSALTGETGAGKSILIDALHLTLGGRGDSGMIREGAGKADICAEFSVSDAIVEWLRTNDIECEEDSVLMRRTIDCSGRSRGFVNGVSVTTSQMRELAALLIDIHGQNAHQSLLKADEQRNLLDRHAGLEQDVEKLAALYKVWQSLLVKIHEAETDSEKRQAEKERLEWQVGELERLGPKAGEWELVNNDYDRLSHAASLIEGAGETLNELSESDSPVLSRLGVLVQKLSRLADIDDKLAPIVELLESARIQLQEAAYGLRDYLSRTDLDPALLQTVEKRLEALHSAARQFKIQPESLPEELENRKNLLLRYEKSSSLAELRKQEIHARDEYFSLAKSISSKRRQAGKELGDAVTAVMEDLHMSGGRFAVEINAGDARAYGTDQVEFLVAGHAGTNLRPLAKVASGGELARISLAISVIASRATATPTLIFDEVDSGVGGAVAEVVGQLLKRLGKEHQVLCVTHLPQVASQATQHFHVSKTRVDHISHPVSRIKALDDRERVVEIARMLGGVEITEATLNHAREMLKR